MPSIYLEYFTNVIGHFLHFIIFQHIFLASFALKDILSHFDINIIDIKFYYF